MQSIRIGRRCACVTHAPPCDNVFGSSADYVDDRNIVETLAVALRRQGCRICAREALSVVNLNMASADPQCDPVCDSHKVVEDQHNMPELDHCIDECVVLFETKTVRALDRAAAR